LNNRVSQSELLPPEPIPIPSAKNVQSPPPLKPLPPKSEALQKPKEKTKFEDMVITVGDKQVSMRDFKVTPEFGNLYYVRRLDEKTDLQGRFSFKFHNEVEDIPTPHFENTPKKYNTGGKGSFIDFAAAHRPHVLDEPDN